MRVFIVNTTHQIFKEDSNMNDKIDNQFTIWIDADGCPVVNSTINIAKQNSIPVIVVKNYSVQLNSDYARIVTVDIARDSADYYIANNISTYDLVITQDYGLAAMVLAKKGFCINQNGKEITPSNIDFILDTRYHNKVSMMQNNRGLKHKKRSENDNLIYEKSLTEFINERILNKSK